MDGNQPTEERAASLKVTVLLLARGRDPEDLAKASRAQTEQFSESQLLLPFAFCQLDGKNLGSRVRQT